MGRIQRAEPRLFDRRRARQAALFSAGAVFGLAIGPALGLVRGPAEASPEARNVAHAVARDASPNTSVPVAPAAPRDDVANTLAAWIDRAEQRLRDGAASTGLDAIARDLSGAGLELVASSVIDGLEADSLERLIVSATDYEAEDLAEIDDVPAFARNLTRIALDGTLRDAEEPDLEVRAIDFSEEITWDHRASLPQSQFASDVPRIYASFESDGLAVGQTLAKWTRVSDGEIMLFKRHRLRPAAASSYVYLDAPRRGWRPGEYRVDFYRADESLEWIASGTHRVTL